MIINKEDLQLTKLAQVSVKGGRYSEFNGYFHSWGTTAYLTDDGKDFMVSVGIVEDSHGKIKLCEPNTITFLR